MASTAQVKARSYAEVAGQYALDVVSGEKPACKWVKLACQRHLDDLAAVQSASYPYRFDEALANRPCVFIEGLPHVKGHWAAEREDLRLESWQCFILCSLFGWVKKADGLRRFRIAYICVPRKNGKSILAAGVGDYMFCADGEWGSEIYSGATTEKQAWEVFRPARLMVRNTPDLVSAFGITVVAKSIFIEADSSRFEPVIGKPGDGASPHCAIIDEYHEHDSDSMLDTMRTGMGARKQPLLLVITTAGTNLAGPCKAMQEDVEKVLAGSVARDELFGLIYTIDSGREWAVVRSSALTLHWDNLCSCGLVRTTRIEELARVICANHVTTGGAGQTLHSGVGITRTGRPEPASCAEVVTSSNYSTETAKGRLFQSKDVANGLSGTPSGSRRPRLSTGPSREQEKQSHANNDSLSTGSLNNSTTALSRSRTETAPYADLNPGSYASITAILQEQFGASCADDATRESAFSEILRTLYNEHSDTCKARKESRLNADGTVSVLMPAVDWTSEQALAMANPNLGVSVFDDFLRSEQRNAVLDARKQDVFKNKHLNVWGGANQAFINIQKWNELADPSLNADDFKGTACVIGVDLSSKIDLTARVVIFKRFVENKDHYYVFTRFYLPEDRVRRPELQHYQGWQRQGFLTMCPGSRISHEQFTDDTVLDVERYLAREVCCDPWGAEAFLEAIEKRTRAKPVEIPQRVQYLSEPMKQLEALIADGCIHHDGNPVMTWTMGNLVAHEDKNENLFPNKERSENKIDGAVALITGLARAVVIPASAGPRSVYSTRGIRTL